MIGERVKAARTVAQKLDIIAEELDRHLLSQLLPHTPAKPKVRAVTPQVQEVWDHYQRMMNRPRAKLTTDRRRKIESRLSEGYGVDRIKRAIDGCHGSDFHMGRGEYQASNQYNDITLICRTGSKLEDFERMPTRNDGPNKKFLG